MTNNDLQYTTQKTKDRATRNLLNTDDKTQVFRNVDTYKWKIIMSCGINVIS
jgi:hypothetical protein